MNWKFVTAGLILGLSAGLTGAAYSQEKPETLVKERMSAMTLQWKYLKPLYLMSRGKLPYDAQTVARNAAYLGALDTMAWDGFAPSTKDSKSSALPSVWSEAAKFKAAQEHFQKSIAQLIKVSKGGDEAAAKSAIGDTLNACNACHDNFREKQ